MNDINVSAFIVVSDRYRFDRFEASANTHYNISLFKVYAINGAGAGPKIQLKITMDIKGMSHKLSFT